MEDLLLIGYDDNGADEPAPAAMRVEGVHTYLVNMFLGKQAKKLYEVLAFESLSKENNSFPSQNCFTCVNSFSHPGGEAWEDGSITKEDRLVCPSKEDWVIVPEDGYCSDWS